jgi:epoxyqueuosine reductase
VIDSGKCISYHTIENKGEINPGLKGKFMNRAFGCDICQDVCPWNRKAIPHSTEELKPLTGLLEMKKSDWYGMDEVTYKKLFSDSAIKRARYQGLRRNLDFIDNNNHQPEQD